MTPRSHKGKKVTDKSKNFENTLTNLEEKVQLLESGELSLEESLKAFEEGVTLFKKCKKQLGSAEKKITILTESLKEEKLEE